MILEGYLIIGWLVRLAMIPLVARRHEPEVAMAWLAPIFLFPLLGTAVYFWLGRHNLDRNREKHRRVREAVETDDRLRDQTSHEIDLATTPEHRDLVRLAEQLSTHHLTGFPILGGNDIELLMEPGDAIDRLVADLDAATGTAHLLFFQFIPDETGRRVADALCRAAERGVRCRLLIDAWASREMRKQLKPGLEARGVEVHPVLPMHPIRQPLSRVDIRNHRKIAVLDGRIAYTGSTNIHDPDYDLDEGIWHQISARVEGPAAMQLQMLFVEDWYFATDEILKGRQIFPSPERCGNVPVQTVPGGPSYSAHITQHVLVQALNEANERLIITTPYLVPDQPTLLALRLAALRGVETHVIIPEESDRTLADAAARAYFSELMDAGVHLHLHCHGILHAKTFTIDDAFAIIGTANFDRRSMFLNYEDMLLIYSPDCTEGIRAKQLEFLDDSRTVDPDAWPRRPKHQQYIQHTAKLLSPVL